MRILVTGAAGFLGRALLRTLASRCREDQITALDLAPPSMPKRPVGSPGCRARSTTAT